MCLFFSLLVYYAGVCLGESYNPMHWFNKDGVFWFFMIEFVIWFFPVGLNNLNGDKNFQD